MVGYHNHEFEFIAEGGTTGYDILLSQTDPEFVTMELDLYWVADAGKDALEIFNSAPDRFSAVHIKDRTPGGDMAPAGDGEIDFAKVLPDALAKGVERFYIEHDNPADPLVSVGRSYTHLMAARRAIGSFWPSATGRAPRSNRSCASICPTASPMPWRTRSGSSRNWATPPTRF